MTRTPTAFEQQMLTRLRTRTVTRREFEILILRYEHNLTLSQIALALDVARGTVTSTIRRAHQKIEIRERKDAA